MSSQFPPCPPQLKILQHYIKLAADYDAREPVISYWARLYTLQTSLTIDRKSPEARALMTALMDWLEKFKKGHTEDDCIISNVAGQAVVENEAHKLFSAADAADRASNFSKNIVKTFYTAGLLFDVCEVFGEDLTEELAAQRKYAKWKATYIHNCLKKGETPLPGPIGGDDNTLEGESGSTASIGFGQPAPAPAPPAPSNQEFHLPPIPSPENLNYAHVQPQQPAAPSGYQLPGSVPTPFAQPPVQNPSGYQPQPQPPARPAAPGVTLGAAQYTQAQKYCRFAVSSIDYEDVPTAIGYLTKALNLLTKGTET